MWEHLIEALLSGLAIGYGHAGESEQPEQVSYGAVTLGEGSAFQNVFVAVVTHVAFLLVCYKYVF